jgi:hypothetical protein
MPFALISGLGNILRRPKGHSVFTFFYWKIKILTRNSVDLIFRCHIYSFSAVLFDQLPIAPVFFFRIK